MALIHPASAGHGLNLQEGGSTFVWFGLTWSLEFYQQANAKGQVGFLATKRLDARLILPETIKVLKMK